VLPLTTADEWECVIANMISCVMIAADPAAVQKRTHLLLLLLLLLQPAPLTSFMMRASTCRAAFSCATHLQQQQRNTTAEHSRTSTADSMHKHKSLARLGNYCPATGGRLRPLAQHQDKLPATCYFPTLLVTSSCFDSVLSPAHLQPSNKGNITK
jgi:hypothetical protein